MQRLLGIDRSTLPALWDADFLYRAEPPVSDDTRFVLCEINVSSVSPFPAAAVPTIAATTAALLADRRRGHSERTLRETAGSTCDKESRRIILEVRASVLKPAG